MLILLPLLMLFAPATRPSLDERLETIRTQQDVPALAVAAMNSDGELLLQTQVGDRSAGGEPVTAGDLWHIGSCTKSMTALLAATVVRDGLIDWTTTAGDVLPALKDSPYAGVTLRQLLSHTSGIDDGSILIPMRGMKGKDQRANRQKLMPVVAKLTPVGPPGKQFHYSNVNYIVAATMLETRCDAAWETLLEQRVWKPLQIESVGFGAPPAGNPLGHLNGKAVPADSEFADNPPVLGPAGTVHLTTDDFARVAAVHLGGSLADKLEHLAS